MSVKSLLALDRTLHAAVETEASKLKRSMITWVSFLAYGAMVAIAGFFLWMMKNPGMAERLGLIGQKANLAFGGQSVDWASFLGFILEMSGLGGMVLASIILAFVFGREYVEGTAKNMLALPLPRFLFVAAKLVVAAAWFATLTLWAIALSYAVGSLVGLGSLSYGAFAAAAGRIWAAALMAFGLATAAAWIAVRTRGYLAPLGYTIFVLVLAVALGATEWGRWCPWSILLWFTGASGPGKEVGAGSFAVLAAFASVSVGLTVLRESRADNAQ